MLKKLKENLRRRKLKRAFDAPWYLSRYQDVAESGMDAWYHYEHYGRQEGRYMSEQDEVEHEMDYRAYLRANPDVKRAGMTPVEHYLKYGKAEKRPFPRKKAANAAPSGFDPDFYLRAYPDVARAKMDPWKHYLKFGKAEGRLPRANNKALDIIRHSRFFDAEWYSHYYYDVLERGVDPAEDYYIHGISGRRNPGPEFNAKEYLLINPDVKIHKFNPLVHYESYGRFERRVPSLADMKPYVFPEQAISAKSTFRDRTQFEKKSVAIVASFSGDGKVEELDRYLLKGVREISDYIIFVSDNPLFPEEIDGLKEYCDVCIVGRHCEYDFGSYKRGFEYARDNRLLNEDDVLIMLNDSCYGPVNSFSPVVAKMRQEGVDFYGLSTGRYPRNYIQSFMYLFTNKVYTSSVFKDFFASVKKELSSAYVIYNYEFMLTEILVQAGFTYNTFVDKEWFKGSSNSHALVPTKYTKTLLEKFNYPLVKIKVLQGSSVESTDEIMDVVERVNPVLCEIIKKHKEKKQRSGRKSQQHLPAMTHRSLYLQYRDALQKARDRVQKGEKVRVQYLVNMPSMFPAKRLMEQMLQDDTFEVELYVIPDVRFGDEEMLRILKDTYAELVAQYPFVKYAVDFDENGITEYHHVSEGADLVCYPSPYDVSYSPYNPYYAVRKGILSFHINYGFFRSKYDRLIYRMDNYSNFWKVFLETDINLQEYKAYGNCLGYNAEVVGYAKMDEMQDYLEACPKNRARKKIIVAPHHSVEGGTNHVLALSNFVEYADFFLGLYAAYPEVDFVFRPHPVLFTVLRRPKQWGEEKVQEYLDKIAALPNVEYSTGGNYLQTFAESDGIIQDCGSFLVEYFYTGKPCCYMLKSPEDIENKFSDLGKECLENCYVAYNKEAIREFMEEVIAKGNDPKAEGRARFAREEVMKNFPHVTERILQSLKSAFTA